MIADVVLGLQYGDEGKGKIIDHGTSKEIIGRHGRNNLEETFLKIVRSKDEMA